MALRATIYKVELQVNDLDRQVFKQDTLALACHPSETTERMMVRLLAFSLNAGEGLSFGRGLSSEDEATLWQHDLSGAIRLWIEVGLPDERLLRKASGRADRVILYCYGGRAASVWWQHNQTILERIKNLTVMNLAAESTEALGALAQGTMTANVTVQDTAVWFSVGDQTLLIQPTCLLASVSR